jgi:hypothetical protein
VAARVRKADRILVVTGADLVAARAAEWNGANFDAADRRLDRPRDEAVTVTSLETLSSRVSDYGEHAYDICVVEAAAASGGRREGALAYVVREHRSWWPRRRPLPVPEWVTLGRTGRALQLLDLELLEGEPFMFVTPGSLSRPSPLAAPVV